MIPILFSNISTILSNIFNSTVLWYGTAVNRPTSLIFFAYRVHPINIFFIKIWLVMITERAEDLTYDELSSLKTYNERLYSYIKSFMVSDRNGVLCLLGAKGIGKTFNVMKAMSSVVTENRSLSPHMIIYRGGRLEVLDPLRIAPEDVWGDRLNGYNLNLRSGIKDAEILILDDIHYMVGDSIRGLFDREMFRSILTDVMRNLNRKIILISEDPLPYYSKVLGLDDLNDFLVKLGLSPDKPNPTSLTPIPPLSEDAWRDIIREYGISFKDETAYSLIYSSLPTPRGVLRLVNLLIKRKILKEDEEYQISIHDVMKLIERMWINYKKQLLKRRKRGRNINAKKMGYSSNEIRRRYRKILLYKEGYYKYYYDLVKEAVVHEDTYPSFKRREFNPLIMNWLRNLCYDIPTRHYIEGDSPSTRRILNMIEALAEKYRLPPTVVSTSHQLLKSLDRRMFQSIPNFYLASALTYFSAEYLGVPVDRRIIQDSSSKIPKKIYHMISLKLNKRVVRGLSRYIPDFLIYFPYDVVSEAYELIKNNRMKLLCRKPILVWLAAIYLIMKKYDPNYTIQDMKQMLYKYEESFHRKLRWTEAGLRNVIRILKNAGEKEKKVDKKTGHENIVRRYLIEFKTLSDRSYDMVAKYIGFDRLDEYQVITRYYIVSDKELKYFRKIPNSKVEIIEEFYMKSDVEVPDEIDGADSLSEIMKWVDKVRINIGEL